MVTHTSPFFPFSLSLRVPENVKFFELSCFLLLVLLNGVKKFELYIFQFEVKMMYYGSP